MTYNVFSGTLNPTYSSRVRPFPVGPRVVKMLLTDCYGFGLESPLLKLTEKDSCYEVTSTRNKLIIVSICNTDSIDVDIEVF